MQRLTKNPLFDWIVHEKFFVETFATDFKVKVDNRCLVANFYTKKYADFYPKTKKNHDFKYLKHNTRVIIRKKRGFVFVFVVSIKKKVEQKKIKKSPFSHGLSQFQHL